ncbi:hypothetical protein ACFFHC_01320 [Kytococcus schroeteri]|uniref:hypothetical protein n=1 Tax=Kytococcus schroeteri TaxID=138300 RepID=UPI0035E86364
MERIRRVQGARGLEAVRQAVRGRRSRPAADPVPRLAMGAVGGSTGRHALPRVRGPWFPAAVLVALSALPMLLAVLQKNNCITGGWRSPQLIWRMCYSDPVVRWANAGLDDGHVPWSSPGTEMAQVAPVRTTLLWLAGLPLGPVPQRFDQQAYFAVWAVLLVLAVAALVVAVVDWARAEGSDPWAASHVALSPLLVPLAMVSDLLVWLALAVWGCVLWRRGSTGSAATAGVVWVLAVLAMPLLVVLPVACVVAAPRALRWAWVPMVLTAAAVCVPWLVWNRRSLSGLAFWDAGAGNGGVWSVVRGLGAAPPGWAVATLAVGGLVLGALLGGVLARRATTGQEVGAALGGGALVAAALQPEVPTQFGLLAVPFVALAGWGWRTHLWWVLVEGLHFVFVWMYLGRASNTRMGMPEDGYAAVVALRLAAWVVLVTLLVLRSSRTARLR